MNNFLKILKNCSVPLFIGLFGALLSLTSAGLYLEEDLGLTWLFNLRGPLPAPEQVVIVSIDRASAEILRLPDDPEKWPRSYYARLIEKINQQNPAIIAFNIYFGEVRNSEDDDMLAKAMATHKNIILSNYLKQYTIPSAVPDNEFSYERIIDPIAILDRAAIATAPFPLPKTSSTVKQFWTYKRSAGDIPTFPVTTYQYYIFKAVYPEILQILQKINPLLSAELPKNLQQLTSDYKTIEIFQKIQAVFDNATLSEEFTRLLKTANYPTEKLRLLESWLFFLNSADSLYLNHYGKAGTITTIPFYQALVMDILNPQLFQNKVVLVGYSETIEPEKNQGFYNGFSDKQSVSAIEIAANAVANLIDNNWLKPLSSSAQFILILCWGILLSTIFRLCAYKLANRTVIFLSFLYSLFSYYQFADANVWIPLTIPLLQTVAIILLESVTHLAQVRKVSERYLPEHVFNTNLKNPDGMNQYGNIMHGVCMATDAGQYTTLSETMRPLELNVLMNNYYAAMFPQVKKYRGIISDVIGDAMMAIWAKPDINKQVRIDACHAALAIQASINAFNQSQQHQLPTRFGLHYGEMRLGNVGAIEHYEYRAVGDCINTASRIENLNKTLGTRILVSAVVIDGLTQFVSREIGAFILKGKTQALTVFELLDCNQEDCQTLLAAFSQALKLFQSRQWQQAEQAFQAIIDAYPEDGPSRFYLHHLNNLPTCPAMHENANQPVVIEIA